jgi:hypothetical protein
MSKFFVSPSVKTDLQVSPEVLKQALLARWPNAQIQNVDEGNRLFTWSYSDSYGPVTGYLNRKQQVIVLDGDVRDCAEFARWYRQVVDSKYELVFYDDAYSNSIPVSSNVSVDDLSSPWL